MPWAPYPTMRESTSVGRNRSSRSAEVGWGRVAQGLPPILRLILGMWPDVGQSQLVRVGWTGGVL